MTHNRVEATRAANDPLSSFSNADLTIAEHRAWYEAAREWSDYRNYLHRGVHRSDVLRVLRESAESAEQVWHLFYDESRRREADLDINSPRTGAARTIRHERTLTEYREAMARDESASFYREEGE